MYSDRSALLAAIRAHPLDDTPRLVFADWCGDNGFPDVGAFIRDQVEAARVPADFNARVTASRNFLSPKRPEDNAEYKKHIEAELERYGFPPETWGEWVQEEAPYAGRYYTNFPNMEQTRMNWLLDTVFELPRTIPATDDHPEFNLRGEWQNGRPGGSQYAVISGFERGLPVVRHVLPPTLDPCDFRPEHIPEPLRQLYGVRGQAYDITVDIGRLSGDYHIPEGLEVGEIEILNSRPRSKHAVIVGVGHVGDLTIRADLTRLEFEGGHTGNLALYDANIANLKLSSGRVGDTRLLHTVIGNKEGLVIPPRCHGGVLVNCTTAEVGRIELPEDIGQRVSITVPPEPRGLFSWLRRTTPPETIVLLDGEPASTELVLSGVRQGHFANIERFDIANKSDRRTLTDTEITAARQVHFDALAERARAEQVERDTRWQEELKSGKWGGVDGRSL